MNIVEYKKQIWQPQVHQPSIIPGTSTRPTFCWPTFSACSPLACSSQVTPLWITALLIQSLLMLVWPGLMSTQYSSIKCSLVLTMVYFSLYLNLITEFIRSGYLQLSTHCNTQTSLVKLSPLFSIVVLQDPGLLHCHCFPVLPSTVGHPRKLPGWNSNGHHYDHLSFFMII